MLNPLIAFLIALAMYGLVTLVFGSWIAGIVPALIVFGIAVFLLGRRTGQQVTAELAPLMGLLQGRKFKEAEELLQVIQNKHGRWQPMLSGQLDAQRGMLEYLQLNFDKALPLLVRGKFRNWMAQASIGAIHYRKGDKEKAWEFLEKASKSSSKEVMVYVVWSVLLHRDGKRTEALQVLTDGLKAAPDSDTLKQLKQRIANKKPVDVHRLPQTWYQFFPEDAQAAARRMRMQQHQQAKQRGMPGGKKKGKARMNRRALRGR